MASNGERHTAAQRELLSEASSFDGGPPPSFQSLRPERKSHRLNPDVYANPLHQFHFTLCGRHHGRPFLDDSLARMVTDSLLWTRDNCDWTLYCYCLMPDHLHLMCRLNGAEARSLNAGMRGLVPEGVLDHLGRFKSFTTSRSWRFGFEGPLWQRSSYDRAFDLERPFVEVAQYVLDNPVRKGLVERWQDWPYSAIIDRWEA